MLDALWCSVPSWGWSESSAGRAPHRVVGQEQGDTTGQHHPAASKHQGDPASLLPALSPIKNPKRGKLQGEQPGWDVGLGHQSTWWLWERAWGCSVLPQNRPNVHTESPGAAGRPCWCQLGDSGLAAACCRQHLAGGRHAGRPHHRNRSITPKVSPEVTRGWSTALGQSVCKKSKGHKIRCESK